MDLIQYNVYGVAILNPETSQQIAEFEKQIKILKDQEEQLKQKILEEMQANNIIKIDTPELLINYINETYRETFDSKLFKEQNPELYDAYVKISPVKASIRIKVK